MKWSVSNNLYSKPPPHPNAEILLQLLLMMMMLLLGAIVLRRGYMVLFDTCAQVTKKIVYVLLRPGPVKPFSNQL